MWRRIRRRLSLGLSPYCYSIVLIATYVVYSLLSASIHDRANPSTELVTRTTARSDAVIQLPEATTESAYVTSSDNIGYVEDDNIVNSDKQDIKKVLFLGYHRGGSSITSEIFDIDKRAIFFYEPLDAFYFAYTGYNGKKAQRSLLYANESAFRPPEKWEKEKFVSFFTSLYSCDFRRLPTEFLLHWNLRHTTEMDPFRKAYRELAEKQGQPKFNLALHKCRSLIGPMCGQSVETAVDNGCHDAMTAVRGLKHHPSDISRHQMSEIIKGELLNKGYDRHYIHHHLHTITNYAECIHKAQTIASNFVHLAENGCKRRSIRAIKIVRYTLPFIKNLLEAIPDLKIVWVVRDPRAVAHSRANPKEKAYSREDKERLGRETMNCLRRTCEKYQLDWSVKDELFRDFSDAMKLTKFEEFVRDPVECVSGIYAHIGEDPPHNVEQFIHTHMLNGSDDGRHWGNVRLNPGEGAHKWRSLVSPELSIQMTTYCLDVLRMMSYPP